MWVFSVLRDITMSNTPGFIILEHQGMLAVRGVDAAKFLQGQLTCNLNYVSNEQTSLGARCNPKGRMQSSFRLALQGDGYLLSMSRDLVEKQINELKKFAVFSKSTLSDESADWTQLGLIDADSILAELGIELPDTNGAAVQHNQLLAIRVGINLAELWMPASEGPCTVRKLAGDFPQHSLNDWQLELIRCGIAQLTASSYESFIPQVLNLPALDGVSFKKGCYSGQEIVARMQYLGKQKRHMLRFSSDSNTLPEPGTALVLADGNKAGEVVIAAQAAQGVELLAVAQSDLVTGQMVFLDLPEKPQLDLLSLPYEIDTEKEIQR